MIRHRCFAVYIILTGLLWLDGSVVPAQTTAPSGQAPAGQGTAPVAQSVEGLVRPETVALRRAAAQTRLEALERLLLSPEEAEAMRAELPRFVTDSCAFLGIATDPARVEAALAVNSKVRMRELER